MDGIGHREGELGRLLGAGPVAEDGEPVPENGKAGVGPGHGERADEDEWRYVTGRHLLTPDAGRDSGNRCVVSDFSEELPQRVRVGHLNPFRCADLRR